MLIASSGGGNKPNLAADLFGPSLRWMLDEAQFSGLKLKNTQGRSQSRSVPT